MNKLSVHYDSIGKQYNHLLGGAYQQLFIDALVKYLQCAQDHKVVDLGAGTCAVAIDLAKRFNLQEKVICVEPSAPMLESGSKSKYIDARCMDALQFSNEDVTYDRMYCRETIHHVTDDDLPRVLTGISNQLSPQGLFVIERIRRPDNFPWFAKMKERFTQQSSEFLIESLNRNGFENAISNFELIPVTLDKQHLYGMLRSRYVSTLADFSDNEIEEGIEELEKSYKGLTQVEFTYEREYIVARKKLN